MLFDHYKDYDTTEFVSTLPDIQKSAINKNMVSMAMLVTSKGMTEKKCRQAAAYLKENDIVMSDSVDAIYYDLVRYCYLVSPDLMGRRRPHVITRSE